MFDQIAAVLAASNVEWLGLAGTLLGIAASIARAQRRSAASQGARIGRLERQADSEQVRRQQVEAALTAAGLTLPYWPPDGPDRPRPRGTWPPPIATEPTTEDTPRQAAPVPPFPTDELARLARHRREARTT